MSCHKNDYPSTTSVQSQLSPLVHPSDENAWKDIDSATRHLMKVAVYQPLPEGDDIFDNETSGDFLNMDIADGLTQFGSKPAHVQEEFETGSSEHSKTNGMQYEIHPSIPGECMVLQDTEGLHDAEVVGSIHGNQIFDLVIAFVNATDYEDYRQIFQTLEEVLRDFMLGLEVGGKRITANKYFDKMLELKPMPEHLRARKERDRISDYNEPRERILNAFLQMRGYFVLRKLVDEFLGLTKMDTATIQSGSVLCVERPINRLVEMGNTNAIDRAVELYRSTMSHHVDNDALSVEAFEIIHQNAMVESKKVFYEGRKFDNDGSYEERFRVKIANEYCNVKERWERKRDKLTQKAIEHGRSIYLQEMQNTIDDMPYSLETLHLHESACLKIVFTTIREELYFLSNDEWETEKKLVEEIYQKELDFFKLNNKLIESRMQNDPRERIERMMFRYDIYMKKDLPLGVDLIHSRHMEMEADFRIELKESFPNMNVNTWNKLLVGKLEDGLHGVHLENQNRLKQCEYERIVDRYIHMETDLESKHKEITILQDTLDELKHTQSELDAITTELVLNDNDAYTTDTEVEEIERHYEEESQQRLVINSRFEITRH